MSRRRETINLDAVAQLTAEKKSAAEIAAILGFTPRTVTRARVRAGVAEPGHEHLNSDERAIIFALAEQRVPTTWIADTIRRSPEAVHRTLGNRPEIGAEWMEVWPEILHNRKLLDLHREFAPRRTREIAA